MTIGSLDGIAPAPSDPLAALGVTDEGRPRSTELGQSDFLKLMTTQLKSQDPLEPMDNGAFIAQMAQFSTVSGMDRLVRTVDDLAGTLAGGQALEASALIGREVLVPAPEAVDTDAVSARRGAVELPDDAFDVRLRLEDAAGRVLGGIDLGDAAAGLVPFDYGPIAPASGRVRLVAEGSVGGERMQLPVLHERSVEAVTLGADGGGPELALEGGGTTGLSSVRRMY